MTEPTNKTPDEELLHKYFVQARTKLHLAYPDDDPKLDELHIVGVTLKGLADYEEVIRQFVTEHDQKLRERLVSEMPKKWILKQEDWHKYDTQYKEHDKALDQAIAAVERVYGDV